MLSDNTIEMSVIDRPSSLVHPLYDLEDDGFEEDAIHISGEGDKENEVKDERHRLESGPYNSDSDGYEEEDKSFSLDEADKSSSLDDEIDKSFSIEEDEGNEDQTTYSFDEDDALDRENSLQIKIRDRSALDIDDDNNQSDLDEGYAEDAEELDDIYMMKDKSRDLEEEEDTQMPEDGMDNRVIMKKKSNDDISDASSSTSLSTMEDRKSMDEFEIRRRDEEEMRESMKTDKKHRGSMKRDPTLDKNKRDKVLRKSKKKAKGNKKEEKGIPIVTTEGTTDTPLKKKKKKGEEEKSGSNKMKRTQDKTIKDKSKDNLKDIEKSIPVKDTSLKRSQNDLFASVSKDIITPSNSFHKSNSDVESSTELSPIDSNTSMKKKEVIKEKDELGNNRVDDKGEKKRRKRKGKKAPRKQPSKTSDEKDIEKKPVAPSLSASQISMAQSFESSPSYQSAHTNMTHASTVNDDERVIVFEPLHDLKKINKSKAKDMLSNAFKEFYRGLYLLKSFAESNLEAIDKALTKHDHNIETGSKRHFTRTTLTKYRFYRNRHHLEPLIRETEIVYARCFTEGHRTSAMKKLRFTDDGEKDSVSTFGFGLLGGISLALIVLIIYICSVVDSSLLDDLEPVLIIYRMISMILLMTWYWGMDMLIWSYYRINYVFIFEFNSKSHTRYQNVLYAASLFTFLTATSLVLYLLCGIQYYDPTTQIPVFQWLSHIPPPAIPLTVIILLIIVFVFYSIRSQGWLILTIARTMAAPFVKVRFKDFFIADQLMSTVIVLFDIEFTICYFIVDAFQGSDTCRTSHLWIKPVIAILPSLWRFLQSLRRYFDLKKKVHLFNAGKYLTGMIVALSSSLRQPTHGFDHGIFIWWLIFVVISTIYSFYWDIQKDWTLFPTCCKMREHRMLPKGSYIFAGIFNFVLRILWTLTISPFVLKDFGRTQLFSTILAALEVTRRAMWNVFRLENEQINNCGNFRALHEVPLPLPLRKDMEKNLYKK